LAILLVFGAMLSVCAEDAPPGTAAPVLRRDGGATSDIHGQLKDITACAAQTAEQWKALWTTEAPAVDFARETVLVFIAPMSTDASDRAAITDVRDTPDGLLVLVRDERHLGLDTQRGIFHYANAVIAKTSKLPLFSFDGGASAHWPTFATYQGKLPKTLPDHARRAVYTREALADLWTKTLGLTIPVPPVDFAVAMVVVVTNTREPSSVRARLIPGVEATVQTLIVNTSMHSVNGYREMPDIPAYYTLLVLPAVVTPCTVTAGIVSCR
jgi:hypothetical protein